MSPSIQLSELVLLCPRLWLQLPLGGGNLAPPRRPVLRALLVSLTSVSATRRSVSTPPAVMPRVWGAQPGSMEYQALHRQ